MIRAFLIGLVKGYRLLLSPWLGSACRFTPTCSVYSLQALEQHGAAGDAVPGTDDAVATPGAAAAVDGTPAGTPDAAGADAGAVTAGLAPSMKVPLPPLWICHLSHSNTMEKPKITHRMVRRMSFMKTSYV